LQVYSMTLRVLVAIIACGRCNCLGGKHRNFGKFGSELPAIAFRGTDPISVVGASTAGTARQIACEWGMAASLAGRRTGPYDEAG
jgi:hypothetical protein